MVMDRLQRAASNGIVSGGVRIDKRLLRITFAPPKEGVKWPPEDFKQLEDFNIGNIDAISCCFCVFRLGHSCPCLRLIWTVAFALFLRVKGDDLGVGANSPSNLATYHWRGDVPISPVAEA